MGLSESTLVTALTESATSSPLAKFSGTCHSQSILGAVTAETTASRPAAEPTGDADRSLQQGVTCLQRLYIRPFAEAEGKIEGRSRIDSVAPELRRKRKNREILRMGDLISHEGCEFAVIKCEPSEGTLHEDTDYFLDGEPLARFEKIQFSAWGLREMSSEQLFSECVAKLFSGDYSPDILPGSKRVRIFCCNQTLQIGDITLRVDATEPAGLGVVSSQTEIFTNWIPEFEKVHIVPFQDTLPRAYESDIFQDFLKPFLQNNEHKKFCCQELFTYHGVEFKMVSCKPANANARVGKNTVIFCAGVLHPLLRRNPLSPDDLSRIAQLPPALQVPLASPALTEMQVEGMQSNVIEMLLLGTDRKKRGGIFEETLAQIEGFIWPPSGGSSQSSCVVCLGDFQPEDECRRLPCRHVFHSCCVDEWLRRCTNCPICKDNVDTAIRHYRSTQGERGGEREGVGT